MQGSHSRETKTNQEMIGNELYALSQMILPRNERHIYARDMAIDYAGKLVATFLLSFTDETYIFGAEA
jgi:hypothetical protein